MTADTPEARTLGEELADKIETSAYQITADDEELIIAALRASSSHEALRTAWQPIETAPKNRLLLVGFLNLSGKWRSMHAQYRDDLPRDDDAGDDEEPAPAGWYEGSLEAETLFPVWPTHWMPLPTAPALSDTERQPSKASAHTRPNSRGAA